MRTKRVIMLLGYAFLALLLVLAAGGAALTIVGKRLDRESKAYADAAVVAIVSDWDARELEKRASPEYDESVDYDELEEDFESLKEMGELVVYKGSTGDALITASLRYGFEITAEYTANAEFEAGSADIQITLVRRAGQWRILDFVVNPREYSENRDII